MAALLPVKTELMEVEKSGFGTRNSKGEWKAESRYVS